MCILAIMVSGEGLSGESVGNGSKVRGYDDEVLEVSSNLYSSGSGFSTSFDHSATEESCSDFSRFLSQLSKKVGDRYPNEDFYESYTLA